MGGNSSKDQNGLYGSVGVANSSNIPGGRGGAVTWSNSTDQSLWMFGGFGYPASGVSGSFLSNSSLV